MIPTLLLAACVALAPADDRAEADRLWAARSFAEAAAAYEAYLADHPDDGRAWFRCGYAWHAAGEIERAIPAHERAATFPEGARLASYNLACAYAPQGRADDAFAALERALEAGFTGLAQLEGDTDLAALRDDPRWPRLLDRVRADAGDAPWTALHFWIGEWDVYAAATGALAGRNTLTLHDGDVVHERWIGQGAANTGESWNYWDPARGAWVQVWVDADGSVTEFVGTPQDGGILFEGVRTDRDGGTTRNRMFVRPVGNGRVRQTGTTTADGGQTWTPRYDLVYVPRGEPFEPR